MIKVLIFLLLSISFSYSDPSFTPIPIQNIDDKVKYNLGKKLFFDKNLSKDKTVACVNCHILESGGADALPVSFGIDGIKGKVNSPTIFNTKFNIVQDWTGKANTIKQRANEAFLNKTEMAGNIKETINYIKSTKQLYKEFNIAYKVINSDSIFDAIAYYVSNLTTPNSKFDKFLKGDIRALNKNQKDGYLLFKSYGCVSCHNGINVGGNMYQKFGIFDEQELYRDGNFGRYNITKKEVDKNVFKVPSLRNIARTSPYLHHGGIDTLEEVIRQMGEHQLGVNIPLDDILKIKQFLTTLNGEIPNE